jgi:hypothetical protein
MRSAAITNATPRTRAARPEGRRAASPTGAVREARAVAELTLLVPTNNGEERDYPFFASYSKAFPHRRWGT